MKSPEAATEYFYRLSVDSNYIRSYRVKRDRKWTVDTDYGTLDITINLSKPEKDPKAIAAAKNAPSPPIPNVSCVWRTRGTRTGQSSGQENHRIIPITINGGKWGFQYSPMCITMSTVSSLTGSTFP